MKTIFIEMENYIMGVRHNFMVDLFHKTESGENGSFSLNIIVHYIMQEITEEVKSEIDPSWTPYWEGGRCN